MRIEGGWYQRAVISVCLREEKEEEEASISIHPSSRPVRCGNILSWLLLEGRGRGGMRTSLPRYSGDTKSLLVAGC